MALRRRGGERQAELFVAANQLPQAPSHVFYQRLNGLLASAGFDRFVEQLVEPHYAGSGRPGIAPGVYFRMLFIGYFEAIDSQRGIAWRCQDSLSLRAFLGLNTTEPVPDHSSLTRIRDRLPHEVTRQVFAFVLTMADAQKLVSGTRVGVDSTTLEANAAMKSIVRRDTGNNWNEYLQGLMVEAGEIEPDEQPAGEELRRFDRSRRGKSVSNDDWESPADPDSRMIKMKDGTTHLGYKAEHTVDLESGIILSAGVLPGTDPDAQTLCDSVVEAQGNLERAGSGATIVEVAADKGYHSNAQLAGCVELGFRTYIPEPLSPHDRRWIDKPDEVRVAVVNNRRRMARPKGREMQRRRSELVERTFAHICETGGARRTWLRGLEKINKRYALVTAAHNLGLVMRAVFGSGKPRAFAAVAAFFAVVRALWSFIEAFLRVPGCQSRVQPLRTEVCHAT